MRKGNVEDKRKVRKYWEKPFAITRIFDKPSVWYNSLLCRTRNIYALQCAHYQWFEIDWRTDTRAEEGLRFPS